MQDIEMIHLKEESRQQDHLDPSIDQFAKIGLISVVEVVRQSAETEIRSSLLSESLSFVRSSSFTAAPDLDSPKIVSISR